MSTQLQEGEAAEQVMKLHPHGFGSSSSSSFNLTDKNNHHDHPHTAAAFPHAQQRHSSSAEDDEDHDGDGDGDGNGDAAGALAHVIYYICRKSSVNGQQQQQQQLEHPHLIPIPLRRHRHLLLRDVKQRLRMIRGARFASAFAWSYKRSYRNGYVWQDLIDDGDIILPSSSSSANPCAGEYVLKGSELAENNGVNSLATDLLSVHPLIHHSQEMLNRALIKGQESSSTPLSSSSSSTSLTVTYPKLHYPAKYSHIPRQVCIDASTQTAQSMEALPDMNSPAQTHTIKQNLATEIDMKSESYLTPSPPSSSNSTISSNPNYSPSYIKYKASIKAAVEDEINSKLQEEDNPMVIGKKAPDASGQGKVFDVKTKYTKAEEAIQSTSNKNRNNTHPDFEEINNRHCSSSAPLHELLLVHDLNADDNGATVKTSINPNHTINHNRACFINSSLRQRQSGAMGFLHFLNSCGGGLDVKEQITPFSQFKPIQASNHANCTSLRSNDRTGHVNHSSSNTSRVSDPRRITIRDDFAIYDINLETNYPPPSDYPITNRVTAKHFVKPRDSANQHRMVNHYDAWQQSNGLQPERSKHDYRSAQEIKNGPLLHQATNNDNGKPRKGIICSHVVSSNPSWKSAGCSPLFVPGTDYYSTKGASRSEEHSKPNYNANRSLMSPDSRLPMHNCNSNNHPNLIPSPVFRKEVKPPHRNLDG